MRIVSLLASATEIVCALGAGDMLVGRSHECDSPAWVSSLPACSEPAFDVSVSSGEIDAEVRRRLRAGEPLYHVYQERISGLRPDLVITQSHCEVCAITPADLQRDGALPLPARQLALSASSLDDIFASIRLIADALGLPERGEALICREQQRLAAVKRHTSHFRTPTVVVLEWTDPLFAMGNWGPELVEHANGKILLGRKGEFSTAIPGEQLVKADPEYLVIAPCGYDLPRSLRELAVLERNPWWQDLQAVRHGRVAFADGNRYFNRSGMTISRTAEILAEILHGLRFGDVPWEPEWTWLGAALHHAGEPGRHA